MIDVCPRCGLEGRHPAELCEECAYLGVFECECERETCCRACADTARREREARERLVGHVACAACLPHAVARNAVDAMLSFAGLMAVAERWLDERYPADVPVVCDPNSPDPGPRLAAALRDCLAASAPTEERP